MKIGENFTGFNISAKGLRVQRKKMNLIAENISSADSLRDAEGNPYRRKFLLVNEVEGDKSSTEFARGNMLKLSGSSNIHIQNPFADSKVVMSKDQMNFNVQVDDSEGEVVYMPDHPDADKEGYVEMSNVNVVNEMVDMISATRNYEANLTALNASKQMIKDALEI